jgi:two-component sensor histidine kinase/sensor domain CHASE-containing protein
MTTLRRKTIAMLGATLTGLVILLFLGSQVILVNSFDHLEKEELKEDMQNARNSLYWDMEDLERKTADWSVWDETYYFVRDNNSNYINVYLVDETFINQRISFVLFYNESGTLVYSKGMDLSNMTQVPSPLIFIDHLEENRYLLEHDTRDSRKTGMLYLADVPVILTSQPIILSNEDTPIGGVILMGRFLDQAEQDLLSDKTNLSLEVLFVQETEELRDNTGIKLSSGEEIYLSLVNRSMITGSILLNDIYGQPALMLDVSSPRTIHLQGKATMIYFLMILLLVAGIFGSVTLYLLDNSFFSRLNDLSTDIKNIGESQDLSRRIYEEGNDEISNLSSSMNLLLESLEESRQLVLKKDATIKAIIQAMPDMVFQIRRDGTICNYKLSTGECLYESPDGLPDISIDDVLPEDIAIKEINIIEEVLRTGKMQTIQYQLPVKGEIRDFEARIVVSGEDEVMSVVKDITDIKKAEEAHKKDILLREIHHRVKNNLQVISSLLNLQSGKFRDKEVIEAFKESQHRARSMAMAHERLCMSQDIEKVHMEDYIKSLAEYLVSSYGFSRDEVQINLNIKNVIFGIDTSIPLGLIINEMVSNSLKHAFHKGPGKISIEIYPEGDDFIMNIGDDGTGFPENINYRNTDSLGMQLVNSLVEQIDGKIELYRNKGTEFRITFKELSYIRRDC